MRTLLMTTLLLSACTGSDEPYHTGPRLPGPSLVKTICPAGCPDDVLQQVDDPDMTWQPLNDGTHAPVGGLAVPVFLGTRGIHDGTHVPLGDSADLCSLLPSEGACADACDRDLLATHIPIGTCATFVCPLADGRVLLAGGCR